MEGPKFSKRRTYGKNKKKAWRGIDISATEDFLEEQRNVQRTYDLTANTSDLFAIAKTGSEESAVIKRASRRQKKELRCYSNLENTSRIACPRKEYPTDPNFETKAIHRQTCSIRAQKRTASGLKKPSVSSGTEETGKVKDLWGELDHKQDTLTDDYFDEITKRKRVKPPKYLKRKASLRPAVEIPHPGASVNPCYNDHQDLLLEAHVVEMKKQKEERRIFNALDAKFPTAPLKLEEISCLVEETSDAEEEVDNGPISVNPPVTRDKKKTARERRKEKRAKLVEEKMMRKKTKKGLEQKVFSIPTFRKQLAQEKRQQAQKAQEKIKKLEEKKFEPKKLGKIKMVTPDLEVKLSSELVGSLRCLKPEGNLLEDRYRSLQMRNMVEPRKKLNKKKTKKKLFEKKSFREVTI